MNRTTRFGGVMRRFVGVFVVSAWACAAAAGSDFTTFETGQVRPLALSPDGSRLFALNTPDGHLEIFSIGPDGELSREASVPVGLEPIAVAARSDSEVWVVNHLSDSVSIVDVASSPPRVVRTLWVGDEPRDIVFAGPGHSRAFVTTAHRGQNHPDPATIRADLTKSGIGRADVWVFDADDPGAEPGGTPIAILTLFGDTPRALAASPDGSTVYAAVFHSGNGTTAVTEGLVCDGGETAPPCTVEIQVCDNANPPSCSSEERQMPGGLPGPRTNVDGLVQPETGLIVKYDQATGKWLDPLGRDWTPAVLFTLPDLDVFAIDALATPPVETASFAGVGTILFDMVVNPANGKLYVSNTEARNEVRFEGPGKFGGSTVRGHLHEARITVIDGSNVLPRHLNKHIDYSVVPSSPSVRKKSLATPLGMAVTSDGSTLYVAAFGSGKIGVFDTAALENDTFVPDHRDHIPVSGGGPSGLALDESRGQLYVLTRFDNAISVVDLGTRKETQHVPLNNPEPFRVVDGRPFLYDAAFTSSNGEASCSACHVFADLDSLAWDLGNPDDSLLTNPGPFIPPFGNPVFNNPPAVYRDFHPMKGPMTTQTLRGLAGHGPMHWRGDRTGGNDEISQQPDKGSFDEAAAFKKFNVAFEGLLGRARELTDEEMQRFTDFILEVVLPPNPIRALDGSLDAEQQAGRDFYFNVVSDTVFPCNGCHVLDPSQGFFGTDGRSTFEGESQFFKVPHLRNLYQKVGMFQRTGPQIRGFGFLHDGSIDTIFTFLHAPVFQFPDDATRRAVEAFLLAFDSNLAPIVGQQVTLTSTNGALAGGRIDLLIARAQAGECDLVVKGVVAGEPRGAYLTAGGLFQTDRASDPLLTDAQVRALANTPGQELTYTCWPPGSAERAGVDRDGDTVFDGDELSAGTDPGSSTSVPGTAIVCSGGAVVEEAKLAISRNQEPSGDESLVLSGEFVLPTQDVIDPLAHGFEFRVDDKDGVPVFHRVIPRGRPSGPGLAGWKVNRKKTRWVYRDPRDVLEDGIRRVVVRDLSSQNPGTFRFRVRGRRGDFRVDPAALPLEVTVILGGPDEGALGVCGTRAFSASGGPPPSCSASPSGKRIRCR